VLSGLPSVTVQSNLKKEYFAALQHAETTGDIELLTGFLGDCILKSIAMIYNLPEDAPNDSSAGKTVIRNSSSLFGRSYVQKSTF